MKRSTLFLAVMAVAVFCAALIPIFFGCGGPDFPLAEEQQSDQNDEGEHDHGGGSSFKIPVPQGYDWEITQSWEKHCEYCDDKYPSNEGEDSFCESSHTLSCCKYAWDFNLPGSADSGKPALASADGEVKFSGEDGGWGYTVVVDHGGDICSRYAHLLEDSLRVRKGDEVCQGLVLGEIGNTGLSFGSHLHFQFEDCDSQESIEMGFTDGNGIPKCLMGNDIYNSHGDYIALKLTNTTVYDCDGGDDDDDNQLPDDGWVDADCGDLDGCPLVRDCGRSGGHEFPESAFMSHKGRDSASYLWRECAVDGKDDEGFHPYDYITRAEALKISMVLFEQMEDCDDENPFEDVDRHDWFYDYVVCGVSHGVISTSESEFRPNDRANFAEAAKFAVVPAVNKHVINLKHPSHGHFPQIPEDHWAYEYAETLYSYGAIEDPEDIDPEDRVTREEYAVMVASLSPCFCWNIVCEDGCECDQEDFACSDPDGGGTGGSDDDDADDDDNDTAPPDDDDTSDDDDNDDDSFPSDDDDDTNPPLDDDDDDSDCLVYVSDPDMVWVDNYDYLYMDTDTISGDTVFIFALVGGGEVCYKSGSQNHCEYAAPCSLQHSSESIPFYVWWPNSPAQEYPTFPDFDDAMLIQRGGYSGYIPGPYNFAPAN